MKTSTRRFRIGLLGCVLMIGFGPSRAEPSAGDELSDYRRPAGIPYPAANAWNAERELLGRTLFFDPRLSRSGIMSCATCHNPGLDYSDALPRAVGDKMKVLARRTPPIIDAAWGESFFWDGRAATLEAQALGPIDSPDEMNLPHDQMVSRLRSISGYAALFEAAYPGRTITPETVAYALATYERTLRSGVTPFDRWVGGDESAIGEAAKRGFGLFTGRANCDSCHSGWRFTDDSFHDIGVRSDDRGRGTHLPEIELAQFAFKTPTLRNVERRPPYMHDGSIATLEEAIRHYSDGGHVRRPSLSREIRSLELSDGEVAELIAFLSSLNDVGSSAIFPKLPR